MGLDNPIHIAFLLILLLLVFGAKRLPEMGKSMGEGMRGFKESLTGEGSVTHVTHMTDDHTAPIAALTSAPAAVAAPSPELVAQPVPVSRERTPSAA